MVLSRRRWLLVALWPAALWAQPTPQVWPHAAEELPPLTNATRTWPTTTTREEAATLLEDVIYETDVRRVKACPCGPVFGTGGYYVFDTAGQIPSGLNHQQSNLKAILTEGLSLGRAVLLRKPTLTRDHNFNRAFKYNMWGDFISFNRSTFTMTFAPRQISPNLHIGSRKKTCTARLSECVADVSEAQLAQLITAPHTVVPYHDGAVTEEHNEKATLIVRGPVQEAPGKADKVALVRKLPGFPGMLGRYQLRLKLAPPEHIAAAVPPVLEWLSTESTTGKTAVVHVRRGDKIQNRKYCPDEMRLATAPENIAKTLDKVGVPAGSAVYIMSDETDFAHFEPLLAAPYNYKVATNLHFDHLHALLEGCSYLGHQRGLPCENYLLFAIEKEIIEAVPPDSRVVTLPRHDLSHNKIYLMNDFLGPGKPCRSLRAVSSSSRGDDRRRRDFEADDDVGLPLLGARTAGLDDDLDDDDDGGGQSS